MGEMADAMIEGAMRPEADDLIWQEKEEKRIKKKKVKKK